ncbi:antibiotic biosynthesis monooxygenase [Geomonas nitrogeniifigens]|uniref:putative quinol monooxygenase n=1 Tax=Geomonas diazotrophica TaxID=2843197 RepID=UPI001C2B9C37|nr:putative quinol monooxygenase [Geomonas nitrogeniifigens]QXE87394.1 antibiotic biosynthesis monooxygenase [Geomonas nitrogeniifigens]
MSKVTVVAKLTVKQDAIDQVKPELLKLITPTRAEKGCLEYRLHQDNDNPAVFTFYENWESLACLDSHMNSNHFSSYVAAIGDLLEDKVVHQMTEIA